MVIWSSAIYTNPWLWFEHLSGVHVLLVSLLVNQLSGLFLIFLVNQKKLSSLRDWTKKFWSVSEFCLVSLSSRGWTKKSEIDQKKIRDWQRIFCWVGDWTIFFGRQKEMRNRPDNWSTKRLTKSTWTPLLTGQLVAAQNVTLPCNRP